PVSHAVLLLPPLAPTSSCASRLPSLCPPLSLHDALPIFQGLTEDKSRQKGAHKQFCGKRRIGSKYSVLLLSSVKEALFNCGLHRPDKLRVHGLGLLSTGHNDRHQHIDYLICGRPIVPLISNLCNPCSQIVTQAVRRIRPWNRKTYILGS